MKTSEEFRASVYQKQIRQLAARKRMKKQAMLCIPLAVLVVLGSIFAPRLLTRNNLRTGQIPLLLQVGNPVSPKEENTAKSNLLLDADFTVSLNEFARDSTVLLSPDFSENACYSPLSLYYALALTASGAGGETRDEFRSVLHDKGDGWAEEQCGKYYRQHFHDNEESKFWLANSLWIDGHYTFHENFIKGAEQNFYSALFQADFTDPALAEEMTKWVSENTGGLLKPEFEFSKNQMLSVINTIYYNAQWSEQFSREYNTKEEFHKANGSTVTAEFMHTGESFGSAYEGNGFTRASLSLRHSGEMVFILPDEGVSTTELLSDPAAFEEMFYPKAYEEFTSCQLSWSVPKFSFGCEHDLKDMLISLGLETAFDLSTADFSGISIIEPYLSEAKQGTHIGINEDGVEAAAYTEIGLDAGAAMPPEKLIEMRLDRPFLFAILSRDTTDQPESPMDSSLLFVGVCGDPTAS